PDRFGALRDQATRRAFRRLGVAAIEHRAILDHLAAVLAEQLRAYPQIAVLEHAEGRDWRRTCRPERSGERPLRHHAIVGDLVVDAGQRALRAGVVGPALDP